MGECQGGIHEERRLFRPPDDIESSVDHEMVTVGVTGFPISGKIENPRIVVEVLGEIIVGVILVEVSEPGRESLKSRDSDASRVPQRPFSDSRTAVPGWRQNFRDRQIPVLKISRIMRDIVAGGRMAVVKSGHQRGAGGGADAAAGISLSEPQSFTSQLIKSGSLDQALTVAAEISIPEVVRENENNVRTGGVFSRREERTPEYEDQERDESGIPENHFMKGNDRHWLAFPKGLGNYFGML